ncbi:hypothetical protein C8R45DRAFT_351260 [Mycena sanguinolenta]|nr:hypothetical protein C8R45DRAFT_351260 [Mycena sanguinolenta]
MRSSLRRLRRTLDVPGNEGRRRAVEASLRCILFMIISSEIDKWRASRHHRFTFRHRISHPSASWACRLSTMPTELRIDTLTPAIRDCGLQTDPTFPTGTQFTMERSTSLSFPAHQTPGANSMQAVSPRSFACTFTREGDDPLSPSGGGGTTSAERPHPVPVRVPRCACLSLLSMACRPRMAIQGRVSRVRGECARREGGSRARRRGRGGVSVVLRWKED